VLGTKLLQIRANLDCPSSSSSTGAPSARVELRLADFSAITL
jgi:hypothetical protein